MIRFSQANSLHACRVSGTFRAGTKAGHVSAVAATIVGAVLLAGVAATAHAQLATPTIDATKILSACSFPVSAAACGYSVQSYSADRVAVVNGGRDGSTALR